MRGCSLSMLAIERGGKIDEEKTAPESHIYFLLCVWRGVGGELGDGG